MMHGQIWVESEAGQGSEFIFTATFTVGDQVERTTAELEDGKLNLKCLVVDDNPTSLEIFKEMLDTFLDHVDLAVSGEEAVALFEQSLSQQPYQLIVMDCRMPGMSGIDASRHIINVTEKDQRPQIILVTAYDEPETYQAAKELQLCGPLIKPVTPSSLLDVILQSQGKEKTIQMVRKGKVAPERAAAETIRGARVLLVEDNEINQQVACEILESGGLVVDVANNGREGVEMVDRNDYAAVLMDIQMPVMGGLEATSEIRKHRRHKNLPIIAMTASVMEQDRDEAREAGMSDHVAKPINVEALFTTLMKWIEPIEASAVHPAQSTAKTDVDAEVIDLPEIAGIDVSAGMGRVGGNASLYHRLLIKFNENYQQTADEIRRALQQEDSELAMRLAHTVKGVAGNIGAGNLQQAAGKLESAIREEKRDNTDNFIAAFETELAAVNHALEPVLAMQTSGDDNQPSESMAGETEDLIGLLEQLLPHIAKRKPKPCKEIMAEINQRQWPDDAATQIEQLAKWIGKYKFKEAKEVLEKLLAQLP